ncbi:MAG: alanine--tRNA ligase, partial [Chlamydiia bacterium]|nr:alanine--tRNA ligase [Chlamydiia bacterium]
ETGPCGPCSELYYDKGPNFGEAPSPANDPGGKRYLEFWNLVFIEFNRDTTGEFSPLMKKCVDTGAGLERIVEIKMNTSSVFETDILRSLISSIEHISNLKYEADPNLKPAFHVVADHLRCLGFAIADGVIPSNVERGYVLRKVLRRAIRYGRMLGIDRPFLGELLPALNVQMGTDFPELTKSLAQAQEIITSEEENFLRTLKRGGNLLATIIDYSKKTGEISGDDAFKLKDTYGLPIDEILLLASDADLKVDLHGYEKLEIEAKARSRGARKIEADKVSHSFAATYLDAFDPVSFVGYSALDLDQTQVNVLFAEKEKVSSLKKGEKGALVLNTTPFYAEQGGQVGDKGIIEKEGFIFQVEDTQSPYPGVVLHYGKVIQGEIRGGDLVSAHVDVRTREKTSNNHTATHLLHYALRHILGEHVKQAGSIVEPERLRFDFSHHKPVTDDEMAQIEDLVNGMIRRNQPVTINEMSYNEASKNGDILQFFGEKYGAKVRVVSAIESKELCGGTHTSSTGSIGYFRMIREGSVAAGIRRIEAVSGHEAELYARERERLLHQLGNILGAKPAHLLTRGEKLLQEQKELQKEVVRLHKEVLVIELESLKEQIKTIAGIPTLAHIVSVPPKEMKEIADCLMERESSLLLLLASVDQNKCSILVRVSPDLISKGLKANELIFQITSVVEGRGGGKSDQAQGGGIRPDKLSEAILKVEPWIQSLINPS